MGVHHYYVMLYKTICSQCLRVFLLSTILLSGICVVQAQVLHIGGRVFMSPPNTLEMGTFDYEPSEYVFYFANIENETIRFDGIDPPESPAWGGGLYGQYDLKNNLFARFEVFGLYFRNKSRFLNSVAFTKYTDSFNTLIDTTSDSYAASHSEDIFGYNTLTLEWFFVGTAIDVGYKFLKTKTLRPYVYGGINTMYLTRFWFRDYYDSREMRSAVLYQNMNTFKPFTVHGRFGLGLQYHSLAFELFWQTNISEIDQYAGSEKESPKAGWEKEKPNYDYFWAMYASLKINLFSINLTPASVKQKIQSLKH